MKNMAARRIAATVVATAAFGSLTVLAAAPAVAQAAPSVCTEPALVNPSRWEGYCTVYAGELRTITYCDNGREYVGDWIYVRPEPWFVYGDCAGARATDVLYESR